MSDLTVGDGVREKLLLEGWVPGVPDDEGAEDRSNSSPRASDTDGGGTGTDELSGRVDVRLDGGGLEGACLGDGGVTDQSPLPDHLVGRGGDSELGNGGHGF